MKLKKNPVAWITLVVVVLNIAQSYMTHSLDLSTAVETLTVALGGVVIRGSVFSPKTVEEKFLHTLDTSDESPESPAAELVLDSEVQS